MRVLIAPDCFGGTLSATQAVEAIARGWRAIAPADHLVLRPLADGGPGFVDVLHAALGGTTRQALVSGPLGRPVPATWLAHQDTAYIESAQACGLHLLTRAERSPLTATSAGVGELVVAAREAGMRTVVVGLGGSASTDGGAGLLGVLGAPALDGRGAQLGQGGGPLVHCARLAGVPNLAGLTLVAAADVDNPLLGVRGTAAVFGPQKGADARAVDTLERAMTRWARVLRDATGRDVGHMPGSGAAGGLGAALLALGGSVVSGAGLVRRLTGLDQALDSADLVITGEGRFDRQSLGGKLVTSVATTAARRGVPCVVLAGQVDLSPRETVAAGVVAAYSVADQVGSVAASLADPTGTLAATASQVAAAWTR